MTITEYYRFFGEKIPKELSASWDNDGLMCCPDPERTVRRALVTLDVTERVVDEAVRGNYDLVVAHHPLVFRGVKSLTPEDGTGRKLLKLVQAGISVFSFHTRLDAVRGGVNDILAEGLGLSDIIPFGCDPVPVGRIGNLPQAISPEEFADRVKAFLGAPTVELSSAGRPISRVAVLGGSGKDDLDAAALAGADAYLSGELSYHQMVDAPENGMTLVAAGHFYTEFPVCARLKELLLSADETITADICHSNAISFR